MRPDVWENLTDSGEKEDVEVAVLDVRTDRWRDVQLRIQHSLQQLAEVVLVCVRLDAEDALPDTALLEDLGEFNLADVLLEAKDNLIDPIQSFLNGAQRSIYDDASSLLSTHSSNLGYLPPGSDQTVRAALADSNAFRGNKMAQLKQAADNLRSQIDAIVATNRAEVTAVVDGRKTELLGSDFYAKATSEAQQRVIQRVDQTLARVASETQVALILQIGSTFESSDYPGLLDLLAASQQGGGDDVPPPKQTVSVKTIAVPGASGVLETEHDVDRYLAALRNALVQTLISGKRITL